MGEVKVLSRTQRIIVESPSSISVINAGPVGPPGLAGSMAGSATGIQATESLVWIINHDKGFYPAGIKFFSEDGLYELEPEILTYVNPNRILATWPEPIAGTWMIS